LGALWVTDAGVCMMKKVQAIILQIQSWNLHLPKHCSQIDQKMLPCLHQASKNKNKIVAHLTNHGNAHFGPTQQPTNNQAAFV
jgi:hypothetical protein